MNGVSGILGRIAHIEARFEPQAPPETSVDAPPAVDFDPFGDAYQQAVEAARSAPTAVRQGAMTGVAVPAASASLAPITTWSAQMHAHGHAPAGGRLGDDPRVVAAINGVAGAPGARPVGGYGSMPVPSELTAHGNGRVPVDALVPIGQGTHRLHGAAAASWQNLVAAAAADGIDLRITDSYRSLHQQVDLAERKGLYVNGGLAATPGTSNHGWGLAVDADVRDPATRQWLQVNGPRFGWVEAVPREPWHWEFRPDQV